MNGDSARFDLEIRATRGWVSLQLLDLWHYRELLYFLAAVVEAATLAYREPITFANVQCPTVVDDERCDGDIEVWLDPDDNQIGWECLDCGEEGTISDWEGMVWDRRDFVVACAVPDSKEQAKSISHGPDHGSAGALGLIHANRGQYVISQAGTGLSTRSTGGYFKR